MFLFALLSSQVFANSACVGSKSECDKVREIERLSKLTGATCEGSLIKCLEYLQEVYDEMMYENDLQQSKMKSSFPKLKNHMQDYVAEAKAEFEKYAHQKLMEMGYPIPCFEITDYHFCTDVNSKLDNPEDQINFSLSNPPENIECKGFGSVFACKEL